MFSFRSLGKDSTEKNVSLLTSTNVQDVTNENVTADDCLYIAFHIQWYYTLSL